MKDREVVNLELTAPGKCTLAKSIYSNISEKLRVPTDQSLVSGSQTANVRLRGSIFGANFVLKAWI